MAMSSQSPSSQSGELTSDDLQEVFEALYSIAPVYINLGLILKVHHNRIRAIEIQYTNPYDRLREILDYRLNQLPPLTWHDIVRALQSKTVHQHDLARTIESQYITASPAQTSAESSHAAIHTSGAKPSTYAPSQPPLHTVEAHLLANAAACSVRHPAPQPTNPPFQGQGVQTASILTNTSFMHEHPVRIGTTSPDMQSRSPESNNPQAKKPRHDSLVHTYLPSSHMQPHPPTSLDHTPLAQHPQYFLTQNAHSFQDSMCTLYPPQFIVYIRDIYKSSIVGDCRDTKWPPRASEVFIKLAIIDRKKVSFGEEDAYTKAMVMDGNVDAILQK